MTCGQGPPQGTVLAFDFGHRRIGVAVGETHPATAAPLATVTATGQKINWAAIEALLQEWKPIRLVVGIPHLSDGIEGEMAQACRQFAQQLQQRSGVHVDLVDESLSSRAAAAELREHRRSGRMQRRVRRGDTDRVAARVILEHWLAEHTTNR